MNPASQQQPVYQAVSEHFPARIQAGRYEVRFACEESELAGAQALRYRTLYLESGGQASEEMRATQREHDQWDDVAAHVIVRDLQRPGQPVVGTLRLVSSLGLATGQGFYTEQAYDISPLRASYSRILELSRFCIEPEGRSGAILMLIWKFTMQYIIAERFDLMLGCASFPGAEVEVHQPILSYLYKHNLAPKALRSRPIVDSYVDLDSLPGVEGEWQQAKQSVPTLLRGYLKVGAKITDAAIIDPIFNTVFVAIYVDAKDMVVQNHTLVPNS